MFHVMLVLPALVTFGTVAIFVLAAPFCVGMFLQLVLSIVAQDRWVVWVPAGLGVAGAVLSVVCFGQSIPLLGIALYWGVYFLALWLVWLIVDQIRKYISRKLP